MFAHLFCLSFLFATFSFIFLSAILLPYHITFLISWAFAVIISLLVELSAAGGFSLVIVWRWCKRSALLCATGVWVVGLWLMLRPSINMFPKWQEIDLYVYLSEAKERFTAFDDPTKLFWHEEGLVYGDWTSGPNGDGSVAHSATLPCPPVLQKNGSLFIHVFIVKSGQSPDPSSSRHVKRQVVYHSRRLNKYKHYRKTQNLLTGQTEKSEEEQRKAKLMTHEILSHWHPNLTLNLVDDHSRWQKGMLPALLSEALHFNPITNQYHPIFFFNDYLNLGAEYQPLNDTVKELNLTLTFAPMSLFNWRLHALQQMGSKWTQMLGGELFDTTPSLLGFSILMAFAIILVMYGYRWWIDRAAADPIGAAAAAVVAEEGETATVEAEKEEEETPTTVPDQSAVQQNSEGSSTSVDQSSSASTVDGGASIVVQQKSEGSAGERDSAVTVDEADPEALVEEASISSTRPLVDDAAVQPPVTEEEKKATVESEQLLQSTSLPSEEEQLAPPTSADIYDAHLLSGGARQKKDEGEEEEESSDAPPVITAAAVSSSLPEEDASDSTSSPIPSIAVSSPSSDIASSHDQLQQLDDDAEKRGDRSEDRAAPDQSMIDLPTASGLNESVLIDEDELLQQDGRESSEAFHDDELDPMDDGPSAPAVAAASKKDRRRLYHKLDKEENKDPIV